MEKSGSGRYCCFPLSKRSISFSVSGQPAWTTFNTGNGNLYGTPGTASIGSHGPVSITATDEHGAYNSLIFTLNVLSDEEMDKLAALSTLPAVFQILLQVKEEKTK